MKRCFSEVKVKVPASHTSGSYAQARRSQRFLHIGVHEASTQPAALIGCILQNIVLTVIVEPVLADVLEIFALPCFKIITKLIPNREIILVKGPGAVNIKRELPDNHLGRRVLRRYLQAHGDPGIFLQEALLIHQT